MQLSHKRYHLGVFGGSGTGKTTYAVKFAANARAVCVFIFDPDGEFSELMHLPPARTAWEIDEAIRSGWVCFDPHTMFQGRLEEALNYFCRLAFEASARLPGRKFIMVDELGHYMTGHEVPQPLKDIVQTGRKRGLDGIFIGQQPNELHNTVRSQLSEVVCFQLTDDRALEFPVNFGFDPAAVRALGPFEWICRNNRGAETRSRR